MVSSGKFNRTITSVVTQGAKPIQPFALPHLASDKESANHSLLSRVRNEAVMTGENKIK